MQSWGQAAIDPSRPSDAFPRKSALAGLLANALGWWHEDAERITTLQDDLVYAVRQERAPTSLWDYQTADLSKQRGWGRWGPTEPGGAFAHGTHVLRKEYLADACFLVALGLESDHAGVTLDMVERALAKPARPLFLGRKSCPPAGRILIGRRSGASALDVLLDYPSDHGEGVALRFWSEEAEAGSWADGSSREVWDRRDYPTGRFDRSRRISSVWLQPNASS